MKIRKSITVFALALLAVPVYAIDIAETAKKADTSAPPPPAPTKTEAATEKKEPPMKGGPALPGKPALVKLDIIDQPEVLVIGKLVRASYKDLPTDKNPIPVHWGKCFEDGTFAKLEAMKEHILSSDYVGLCVATMYPGTEDFGHIAGMMMKPGTPVPEGFVSHTLKPTKVAVGWIKAANDNDAHGNSHRLTTDALTERGWKHDHGWVMHVYNRARYTKPDAEGNITVDYYLPVVAKEEAKKEETAKEQPNVPSALPAATKLEILDQPEILVVGKPVRANFNDIKAGKNPIPALWCKSFEDGMFAKLEALADHVYKADHVGHSYVGYNSKPDPATGDFEHIAGMLMKLGTPVPEGYVSRTIAPAKTAVSWIKGKKGSEGAIFANMYRLTEAALAEKGIKPDKDSGWSMEVYNCPRWTTPDPEGCIVMDFHIPVAAKEEAK